MSRRSPSSADGSRRLPAWTRGTTLSVAMPAARTVPAVTTSGAQGQSSGDAQPLSSADFFKPLELHLELANFLVQLRLTLRTLRRTGGCLL